MTALFSDLTNKKKKLPKSQISGNNLKELRKSQSIIKKKNIYFQLWKILSLIQNLNEFLFGLG